MDVAIETAPDAGASPVVAPKPGRRIADHGVIGDMGTMALIALDGTIDFMCWPFFDSPSIFASLLDDEKGGSFELQPLIPQARIVQAYAPDSNVLMTRWLGMDASAEVLDLMTVSPDPEKHIPRLIRRVRATRGKVKFTLRCAPKLNYARDETTVDIQQNHATFSSHRVPLIRLAGPAHVNLEGSEGAALATFELNVNEVASFVLADHNTPDLAQKELCEIVESTTKFWQQWAGKSHYTGRWREVVSRSALVLKLMTSQKHGSIVAAATFGLPEAIGGGRNWDYRATWIRDGSFTVYALMRLGYTEEAKAFNRWVGLRATTCPDGRLAVMYRVDGSEVPLEENLTHFKGYEGSRPVRIGNNAATQLQLDIYGELLDGVYLSNKYGDAISHRGWLAVNRIVEYVCKNWQLPDAGIWEVRNEPREHLHSRLMCWVAVDRAIRLASKRSLAAPFADWVKARNEISESIYRDFWNPDLGYFVRAKGETAVDGAMLLMPLVRFIGATDPAWLATLDAIRDQLTDDGLVLRYKIMDGLDGKEGSFAACAFWYVECLARAGRLQEAKSCFEKLLMYGNHLQLYAEEFDPRADQLGNFPQALTHLALISAAFYLDMAMSGKETTWKA